VVGGGGAVFELDFSVFLQPTIASPAINNAHRSVISVLLSPSNLLEDQMIPRGSIGVNNTVARTSSRLGVSQLAA
jgi:hypothetical protein